MKLRPTLCLVLLVVCCASAVGQKPRPKRITATVTVTPETAAKPKPISEEKQRRQDAFIQAWSIINYQYFDKTFSGLDWQKIRQEYLPRVLASKTDDDVHGVIQEMIGRLGRSHFALIPPEYFENLKIARAASRAKEKQLSKKPDTEKDDDSEADDDEDIFDMSGSRYGIGIDLKYIGDNIVISHVDPLSSAASAGLKPGFTVQKINNVEMSELTANIAAAYPNIAKIRQYIPLQIKALLLNGLPDTSVFLTCLDENDKPREFKIDRITLPGQEVSFGGAFPPQFLNYESRALNTEVGYIKFNVFSYQVIDKFCRSLTEFSDKKALVIDLRGNIGGIVATIYGLTGMLTDREITLGTTIYRDQTAPFAISSKTKNFKGKVVMLVDSQTMSASEFLSAGLQENARLLVVGERTAGQALMAVSTKLATGAVMEYPIANFKTPKGKEVEGVGVEPDVKVVLDRRSLLNGIDNQLQTALELIKDGSRFPKTEPVRISGVGTRTGGDSAPPPPPKKVLARASTPIQPPPSVGAKSTKDSRAVKLITDFAAAIGGEEQLKAVSSYEVSGAGVFRSTGTDSQAKFQAFREKPNRYSMILTSDVFGELRQVYSDKEIVYQTVYGADSRPTTTTYSEKIHLFSLLDMAIDPTSFISLQYDGIFEAEGRKLHVIEGKTVEGADVAMTFDSKTGMLFRFTLPGLMYTLEDYRKTGNITLPYSLKLDGVMDIKIDSISLNKKLDPANLSKKEMCFDKPL